MPLPHTDDRRHTLAIAVDGLGNTALFRKEKSGEMHGLIRVAEFVLSDAHIVCRKDQVQQCFDEALDLIRHMMGALGIDKDVTYRFSKWDPKNTEKYINNPKAWSTSQAEIKKVLVRNKMKFVEADDEAAYYGPKIDVQIKNVYGKEDTIITVQLDFALAERFDMSYIDENGDKVRPLVIHHSVIGCFERTLAMLIEKTAGLLPLWLCPIQAVIMGITGNHDQYVGDTFAKINATGIRIKKDIRNEKVGYKIREHTMAKIPFLLVAGDKEVNGGLVSVRTRDGTDMGQMTVDKFIEMVKQQCKQFK